MSNILLDQTKKIAETYSVSQLTACIAIYAGAWIYYTSGKADNRLDAIAAAYSNPVFSAEDSKRAMELFKQYLETTIEKAEVQYALVHYIDDNILYTIYLMLSAILVDKFMKPNLGVTQQEVQELYKGESK